MYNHNSVIFNLNNEIKNTKGINIDYFNDIQYIFDSLFFINLKNGDKRFIKFTHPCLRIIEEKFKTYKINNKQIINSEYGIYYQLYNIISEVFTFNVINLLYDKNIDDTKTERDAYENIDYLSIYFKTIEQIVKWVDNKEINYFTETNGIKRLSTSVVFFIYILRTLYFNDITYKDKIFNLMKSKININDQSCFLSFYEQTNRFNDLNIKYSTKSLINFLNKYYNDILNHIESQLIKY